MLPHRPDMATFHHFGSDLDLTERGVRYFQERYIDSTTTAASLAMGRLYVFHLRFGVNWRLNRR